MTTLALIWIGGLIAYFVFTTERQREQHLVWMWVLLLVPVFGYPLLRLIWL